MTDKQNSFRWQFRYDFLEDWLARSLSISMSIDKEKALDMIRSECEEAFRAKGIKYPFSENEI